MWPADRPKHVQNHNSYSLEDSLKQFEDTCGNCKNHNIIVKDNVKIIYCNKTDKPISIIINNEIRLKEGEWRYNLSNFYDKMCETGLEMKK